MTHVGNALALATGLFLAGYLTAARWTAMRRPAACGQHAMTIGSLCAAVAGFIVALAADGPAAFVRPPAFYGYAALNGLSISAAYVSLGFAPKHARGAEISMVLLLEVVLGPLFIYFRFGEIPSGWTVAGGALLLGTLAAHEACGLHSAAAETMRSPMRRAAPSPTSPNEESSPIAYQPAEVYGL